MDQHVQEYKQWLWKEIQPYEDILEQANRRKWTAFDIRFMLDMKKEFNARIIWK